MAKNRAKTATLTSIDPYSVLQDLLHNLVFILMGTLAAGMLLSVLSFRSASSRYTTSAMFAVTAKADYNYVYLNQSAAANAAASFKNVLQSDVMKNTIGEALGLESLDADITASQIVETNLLKLTVTADSPQKAYQTIIALIDNYEVLTKYSNSEMVMDVLAEPAIPHAARFQITNLLNQKKVMAVVFAALTALFVFLSIKNDTIKSEQDFREKLDTKSLGLIGHAGGVFRKNEALLITSPDCPFEFTEKYRKIAANITHAMDKNGAKTLMITSTAEHEGKSTVAANIALTMAKAGNKVLLVDGDLRRPSIGKMFGLTVEKNHSLPDLSKGSVKLNECVQYDENSGLFILPSREKGYKNSTDIVSSKLMKRYIEYLGTKADYVIIDTPPMAVMADGEVFSQYTDMSVLVVKYDKVQAGEINDCIDVLAEAHAEYAGAVLNDLRSLPFQGVNATGNGYGTYGRYGKYGRYGNYGNYGHYKTQSKTEKGDEE